MARPRTNFTCVKDGCADKAVAHQLCKHHYRSARSGREWKRTARAHESVEVRMERLIERDPNSGCWLWSGPLRATRYGTLAFRGRHYAAHRLSFEALVRPLGPGEVVCHRCDTPLCVNPAHLFAGTQRDNMRDMVAKGRARPRGLTEFTVRCLGVSA